MNDDIATSVCLKLGITVDQLNSLYVAAPVNGFVGTQVAAEIAERFNIAPGDYEPLNLAVELAERDILNEEEARWFADQE